MKQANFEKETRSFFTHPHDPPMSFAEALDMRGIGFARVAKEEAERSQREAAFARALGNYAPQFRAGEIVAVTAPPLEYRKDGEIALPAPRVFKLDQRAAGRFIEELGIARKLEGVEPTKERLTARAAERAQERDKMRLDSATRSRDYSHSMVDSSIRVSGVVGRTGRVGSKVADAAIGKGFDIVADLFASILSPPPKSGPNIETPVASHDRDMKHQERIDHHHDAAARAYEQMEIERRASEHNRGDRGRER